MQIDIKSIQAERTVPKILQFSYSDPKALRAYDLLKDWDFRIARESGRADAKESEREGDHPCKPDDRDYSIPVHRDLHEDD